MAKGQRRSNREMKKPKQKKAPAATPVVLARGRSAPIAVPNKKR